MLLPKRSSVFRKSSARRDTRRTCWPRPDAGSQPRPRVVAYGLDYFGPSRVLTAIERAAAERGYAIMLNLILEPETNDVDHLFSSLRARQVDGIIWAIPEVGGNRGWLRTHLAELPVPVILVGGMTGRPYLPSIAIDNAAIGCLATEHLLAGALGTSA